MSESLLKNQHLAHPIYEKIDPALEPGEPGFGDCPRGAGAGDATPWLIIKALFSATYVTGRRA